MLVRNKTTNLKSEFMEQRRDCVKSSTIDMKKKSFRIIAFVYTKSQLKYKIRQYKLQVTFTHSHCYMYMYLSSKMSWDRCFCPPYKYKRNKLKTIKQNICSARTFCWGQNLDLILKIWNQFTVKLRKLWKPKFYTGTISWCKYQWGVRN